MAFKFLQTFLPASGLLAALMASASPGPAPGLPNRIEGRSDQPRPNIIVLLADDLGWRDLGCTGNPDHRTPNIDRLATEGMRFTDAYSAAPICSASRAALLTGQSPARLHYEFVPKFQAGRQEGPWPMITPDFPTELPPATPTVASLLKGAGYSTAFCGKWHLNRHQGHYLGWRPGSGPADFGFGHCVDDFRIQQVRPHAALRVGQSKLVHHFESGRDELFNLAADPSESRDLCQDQPETVAALRRQLMDGLAAQAARLPARKP